MNASRWLVLDLVLVGVFAAIGRLSHAEALTPAGWWHTAWPFLTGTLVGWVLITLLRRRGDAVTSGLMIWPTIIVAGMVLRHLTDQGTAAPFIIVASIVVGLFVVVPRTLAAWSAHRRTATRATA